MISLMYGSGLRVGELVASDVGDIHLGYGGLHVRRGKGAMDRYVVLHLSLKPDAGASASISQAAYSQYFAIRPRSWAA